MTRPFSTSSAVKRDGPWSDPITKSLNRYVVIAEDYTGPGALARRMEVRDRHLEQAARGKEVGRIGEWVWDGGSIRAVSNAGVVPLTPIINFQSWEAVF